MGTSAAVAVWISDIGFGETATYSVAITRWVIPITLDFIQFLL